MRFRTEIQSSVLNGGFGPRSDEDWPAPPRQLSGVKLKSSERKRTYELNGPLSAPN
jgi:hypothetical protein